MSEIHRKLSNYALSGELEKLYLGGSSQSNKVLTFGDLMTAKGEMSVQTAYHISLDNLETISVNFDTSVIARGGILTNVLTNELVIGKTAGYELIYGLDASFSGTKTIEIGVLINGVNIPKTDIAIQGRGVNKPITGLWGKSLSLNAGDIVKMEIVAHDNNTNMEIEKAILIVKEDI